LGVGRAVIKIGLLQVRQQEIEHGAAIFAARRERPGKGRQSPVRVVDVVRGQADLPHFVRTGRAAGRLASGLDGWQ
jgi:hypothetical protein